MSSSPTMSRSNPNKPHVMCIPYPMQGHINPMLNLAKILHSLDFHITFVNTEFNYNNLINSGALKSFSNLPNFHFENVPDCHPPLLATTAQDYYFLLCRFAREKFLPSLHHLITRLNWCKTVTCIVSDGLMPFNIMIARELGIPGFLFWVPNACAFMRYLQEKGLIPAKDEQQDLVLDSTSVLKNIRLSDTDISHGKIYENDFLTREVEEAFLATGIIFDTFEALEQDVFNAIKPMFQNVNAIGPLQMLLNSTSNGTSNNLKSVSFDPCVDEIHCLKWLDSMKPNSVLYISFGDLIVMTPQQLCEFALGICNSNQPFLWIIRPDFVTILPPEFLEKTKERGLVATRCPHEQVLTHPSVGVFVSNFGTSSMLESISAGVPLIGWPYYGDHQVSCKFSCNRWGIGMKINEDVKREEVESLVRELIEGDKGKEMKTKVMEWKKLAVEATSKGGSSEKKFNNLLQASSGTQNLTAATYRRREIVEVVVTSKDTIKPSRPTPQHLRHVPLSFFDRIMYRVFIPMIYFYSKGSKKGDIIKATNLETSNHLKTSLAETLVKFYPLAGRVKEYHTECNDQGVPYFEAQANCQLSQVVGESSPAKLNKLLPYAEQAGDLPLAIQVTFFDCGGIAIGTCFSQKVVDASSWSSFLNFWAAVAREDHCSNINLTRPRFDLAKLFPPIEKQISYGTTSCTNSVARRFVLSASALSAMRSKYKIPTSRAEALAAFIWTRFLASGEGKDACPESKWLAYHAVDLRTRMDPPVSEYHIGNLVGFARVGSSMDDAMKNDYAFIKKSRDATTRVDAKFVKNLQKAEFALRYLQSTKDEHASSLCFSSLSKFRLYDADFGWGRPTWVTMSGLYTVNSLVFLPTRSGDGIEVLLYLKEDDMAKLEADKEFLEFVSPPSGVKTQILSSL